MRWAVLILCAAPAAADETPTFNRDVAPIIYRRCAGCHHDGETAPFPLVTYAQAYDRADLIDEATENRSMPPWKPVAGWSELHDERTLPDDELATLQKWARNGTPEGAPPAPPSPQFSDEWALGAPDAALAMSDWFQVPARADDIYQCFVVPVGNAGGRDVTTTDFHPGSRHVVRNVALYVDTTGAARALDAAFPGLGYRCANGPGAGVAQASSIGAWTPGSGPRALPLGAAFRLPVGGDLVMQVHYHPVTKPEADRSTLGLYFAKAPPAKQLYTLALRPRRLTLPAGAKKTRAHVRWRTPIAVELVALGPQLHALGKSVKVTARLPDGGERKLLYIDDWDADWQSDYTFKDAVPLPAGSTVDVEAVFDNSADNPHNMQDPPKAISGADKSGTPLIAVYLTYATANADDKKVIEESFSTR